MSLRALMLLSLALLPLPALADPATQWWADMTALAGDDMKGRLTGSDDYLRAADYVIGRLKAEGLKPAGINGYLQPIPVRAAGGGPGGQQGRAGGRRWNGDHASRSATTC